MGVDISYKVKFINSKNEVIFKVRVTDRDNELKQHLSQEEYKLFWLEQDPEDLFPAESEILDAKEALEYLNQLVYSHKKNLNLDTTKSHFIDYFVRNGFYYYQSLGILIGIVKTAIEMDCKIQLEGEYY